MFTVLLVDDDSMVLRFCACVLSRMEGVQVIQASSGAEAIGLAASCETQIDLLLSDITMPGAVSGIDLATWFGRARPGTRVLLMSGWRDGPLALPADWHFLEKPFLPDRLIAEVNEALGRRVGQVADSAVGNVGVCAESREWKVQGRGAAEAGSGGKL
ncbi:MAG TPA: response regulator [Bryobacteraceae bacterium]|nr:response regulator [Bryobacteraceae bacterium]